MGTVYNRGTRAKPNWYIDYTDETGRRRRRPSGQPTKAKARERLRELENRVSKLRLGLDVAKEDRVCGPLLHTWQAGLRNRSASDDRGRLRLHVAPKFAEYRLSEITLAELMAWIDELRAAGKLSEATIRHCLNLVSRFFSWAIERGHAEFNPVRQIPTGRRPKVARKKSVPWLEDDALTCRLIRELPEPLSFMFYLGNRSGLREGEIVGLRMSDFDFIDEHLIRVRHSCAGPLKEDKHDQGKMKWAPAADGCKEFLAPWLDRRRQVDAGPEDFVFPGIKDPTTHYRTRQIQRAWSKIAKRYDLELTWHEATRHTFASRCLAAGASLDEVSAALGHSSPIVTRRFYDHYVRRSFSPLLRRGLGQLSSPVPSSPSKPKSE